MAGRRYYEVYAGTSKDRCPVLEHGPHNWGKVIKLPVKGKPGFKVHMLFCCANCHEYQAHLVEYKTDSNGQLVPTVTQIKVARETRIIPKLENGAENEPNILLSAANGVANGQSQGGH